jgi:uncharacterized protein YjbJ (UPF0337 family)
LRFPRGTGFMNIDQAVGRMQIALGRVWKMAGAVIRNPALARSGQREQRVGQVRARYGDAVAAVERRAHWS